MQCKKKNICILNYDLSVVVGAEWFAVFLVLVAGYFFLDMRL